MRARHMIPAILLAVPVLLLPGGARAQTAQRPPPGPPAEDPVAVNETRAIKVTGEGEVEVAPDEALVALAVETTGRTAEEAGRLNSNRTAAVIHTLKEKGIAAQDIETGRYDLFPNYPQPPAQKKGKKDQPTSYRAVNSLQVTVKDLKKAGEVIDAALKVGANRVEQVSFQVSNPAKAQQQALQEAVQRARAQAGVLAQSLGVELGPVLEASTITGPPPPVPLARTRAAVQEAAPTTPIEPQAQTITASVTLVFEIGS
jgi:uncharacterized protein